MNASSAQASSHSAAGGKLPPGTCDCHYHVFDASRYPYAPERHYTPPDATLKDYLALCARFGIDRSVLVHPTPFGADHRSFEEVLTLHGDRMRGVAVVSATTTEDDIARWHKLGARGTRLTPVFHGSPHGGTVEDIVAKIKPFGWHVQLLVDVVAQPDLAAQVHSLGVEVVVDHLGHHDAPVLRQSAGFANLLALLKEGVAWTKLSAPYRSSATSHSDPEIQHVVDALLAANVRQLVWGTDWPHPASPYPVPEDAQLVRLVNEWLPQTALRDQVLVQNPTRLYWA